MEMILQNLTEVGVCEIVLVQTKRSVSKVDDKKEDKKSKSPSSLGYDNQLNCLKSSTHLLQQARMLQKPQ